MQNFTITIFTTNARNKTAKHMTEKIVVRSIITGSCCEKSSPALGLKCKEISVSSKHLTNLEN